MTRPVNDDASPRDEDEGFQCAPANDGQSATATSSDVKADNQEETPEEAGYGYGV